VRRLHRSRAERFDVVFYVPWASSLLGASSAEVRAAGGETQQLWLAGGLAERGLNVGAIVLGTPSDLPEQARGVRVLAQPPRRRTSGALARTALAVGAFRSMIGVRTRVLIQRNAGPTTAVAAVAARLRGAQFIYSSANVLDFEFGEFERRSLNVRLYEWGVRSASAVVVQTGEQGRMCRERFRREASIIRSLAGRPRLRTQRPEAFLWVGRLHADKRPIAYLELARALPEAEFWMIAPPYSGEPGELRRALEEGSRQLPNLRLLEPRSREGVGQLMEQAVALVSTSDVEGMPNVMLEAWTRGVPALALSFDPDGVIERHGLGAFAGGDRSRFEQQAGRFWLERDDQTEVAARCMAYIETHHSEDAVVESWLRVIQQIP
jgi:glycosyltransferase involved in cell wall biosynthesis